MATTALFAELVIGGIQSLGWVAVVSMLWFPPDRLLAELRSLSTSEGIIILIIGYSVGLVFDRVWDALLKPVSQKIKLSILKRTNRADTLRKEIFSGTDVVRANFVDSIRIRMRVARATFCNSLLTAIAAFAVWNIHATEPWSRWLPLIGAFYAMVTLAAAFAFQDILKNYYKTLLKFEA